MRHFWPADSGLVASQGWLLNPELHTEMNEFISILINGLSQNNETLPHLSLFLADW